MAKAKKRFNNAFLQYTNGVQLQTSSGTLVDLALATNLDSRPETKFTKLNDTDFRCDFDGEVFAVMSGWGYPDANDRGWRFTITKNGVEELGASKRATAKADINRASTTTTTKIIPVANGDIIRFAWLSLEGNLITIPANVIMARVSLYSEN